MTIIVPYNNSYTNSDFTAYGLFSHMGGNNFYSNASNTHTEINLSFCFVFPPFLSKRALIRATFNVSLSSVSYRGFSIG